MKLVYHLQARSCFSFQSRLNESNPELNLSVALKNSLDYGQEGLHQDHRVG